MNKRARFFGGGVWFMEYFMLAVSVASIAALSAVVVPTFNILTVILFETARGGKVPARKLLTGIFMNPLVDAGILGIVVGLLEIRLPELLAEPLEKLGEAATPLALGGDEKLAGKSLQLHPWGVF